MPVAVWHVTPLSFIRRPSPTRRLTLPASKWKGAERTLTGGPRCRGGHSRSTCSGKTFLTTATLRPRPPADTCGACYRDHSCGTGPFTTALWHCLSLLCLRCCLTTLCKCRLPTLQINLCSWKAKGGFDECLSSQTSLLALWRFSQWVFFKIHNLPRTTNFVEYSNNEALENRTWSCLSQRSNSYVPKGLLSVSVPAWPRPVTHGVPLAPPTGGPHLAQCQTCALRAVSSMCTVGWYTGPGPDNAPSLWAGNLYQIFYYKTRSMSFCNITISHWSTPCDILGEMCKLLSTSCETFTCPPTTLKGVTSAGLCICI